MQYSLIVIILFFTQLIFCQRDSLKEAKNEFKLYYHTTFSKMNFDIENHGGSFLIFWKNSKEPNRFYRGVTYGGEYSRFFKSLNKINLGFRHTEKGLQSSHLFDVRNHGNVESSPSGYGGVSYEIKLTTNEFILSYERLFQNMKNLSFSFSGGMSVDFFNEMVIRDFIIERKTGIKRPGCCINSFYGTDKTYWERVKNNISKRHFRLGLYLGGNVYYKIVDNLFFNLRFETIFLTKLIHKTRVLSFPPDGNGIAINIGSGISYKF